MPKYIIVASDDEFMQMDWTHLWYDQMPGETHLSITPNTEHTQLTGIFKVLACAATFARSIMLQTPRELRPSFNYTYNYDEQSLEIWIPEHLLDNVEEVRLRYAQTLQGKRRDFRWATAINDNTGPCRLPAFEIPLKWTHGKKFCFQTIFYKSKLMEQQPDYVGHFKISIPQPMRNLWMGFYGQIKFRGEHAPSG